MDINDPPSIQIPQQRLAGFHPQIPAIDDGELIQNDPVIQQALSREEENQNHDQLMEINQNIQMDLSQITDLLPRAQTMMKNRRRNKRKRRREAMEASDNTVVHVDQREEQTHEHKRRKISQMRRRNDSEDQVNRIIIRKALTPRIYGAKRSKRERPSSASLSVMILVNSIGFQNSIDLVHRIVHVVYCICVDILITSTWESM
eukprot:682564_1